jgi:hypothetical protein
MSSITIISEFNVNDKIYKKYCDRIVPGVILTIIFDGKQCSYGVQFADDERDVYTKNQFCTSEDEICYPIEIAFENDEEDDDEDDELKKILGGDY